MLCKATEAELLKVECQREPATCAVCCIYHACAQGWKTREVWRDCAHFAKGRCSFQAEG